MNGSLLFKGEMVRGIRNAQRGVWPAAAIDGERPFKWQTRRVMGLQPPQDNINTIIVGDYHPIVVDKWGDCQPGPEIFGAYDDAGEWGIKCPYGKPGDVAWVRETWAVRDYGVTNPGNVKSVGVSYRADGDDGDWNLIEVDDEWYRKIRQNPRFDEWRPSIHMPRWASRDDLLIQWIRAERVRDISQADAQAEGVAAWTDMFGDRVYRSEFSLLWDRINGEPKQRKTNPYTGEKELCYVSYPWADERGEERHRGLVHYVIGNPWVWVIAFMRLLRGSGE